MCSTDEGTTLMEARQAPISHPRCIKCKEALADIHVRQQSFCRNCFMSGYNHRFKAALGKHYALHYNDRVLVACSGGNSSIALLKLVHDAVNDPPKRRLNIQVVIAHISEQALFPIDETVREEFRNHAKSYGFEYKEIPLEYIFSSDLSGGRIDTFIDFEHQKRNSKISVHFKNIQSSPEEAPALYKQQLLNLFNSITTVTAKEQMLQFFHEKLLIHLALQNDCRKIMFADCSTRLAVKCMANTSTGRGFVVPLETTFSDKRFLKHTNITLLRPLLDVSSKEVAYYNHLCRSPSFHFPTWTTKSSPKMSIERVSEEFIVNLQHKFPSTVEALNKTVAKLALDPSILTEEDYCVICKYPKQKSTQFWRDNILSLFTSPGEAPEENNVAVDEKREGCSNGGCNSTGGCKSKVASTTTAALQIAPFACYGCQTMMNDFTSTILPSYIGLLLETQQKTKHVENNSDKLREQIAEFLLEDEEEAAPEK